jgi:hypothetical protein
VQAAILEDHQNAPLSTSPTCPSVRRILVCKILSNHGYVLGTLEKESSHSGSDLLLGKKVKIG